MNVIQEYIYFQILDIFWSPFKYLCLTLLDVDVIRAVAYSIFMLKLSLRYLTFALAGFG